MTSYTMFSYLLIPIYGQDTSENDFFDCGHEISILLDFYRHLLSIIKFNNSIIIDWLTDWLTDWPTV